jgi:hypothetical protein
VTSNDATAPDPVLHWAAIAAHARREHGARWATDQEALHAVIGAFDSILPTDYGYRPLDGSIRPRTDVPAGRPPTWRDHQALGCAIATLAALPPPCDLEVIYRTENIVARVPRP